MKFRLIVLSVPVKLLASVTLFWSFSRIVIAAGHGAGFVSGLMIYGRAPEWRLPQIAGWLAVAAELASYFVLRRNVWAKFVTVSTASLTLALGLFLARSETLRISEWDFEMDRFALFAALVALRIFQIVLGRRADKPNAIPEPNRPA